MPDEVKPTDEVVMPVLHASAKFGGKATKPQAGGTASA
jgi:DNA gyrase/topoisomerase IV subunit B